MKYRASKLTIKEVPADIESAFLNEHHYQGYFPSKVCFGLYDNNNELVELMSFGKPRFNKHYDYELLRLCTKSDDLVYGGASKLFKHFTSLYNGSIISYCNKSLFTGKVYEAIGFVELGTINSYYYEYNGKKILRYSMQKSKNKRQNGIIENIQKTLESFGKQYDPNLSELQNATNAGFKKIDKLEATYVFNKEWYVYQITDSKGRTYIGQHIKNKVGDNPMNDNYYGSGTIIKRIAKKDGIESLSKTILVDGIKSQEEADSIELRLINEAKSQGHAELNILTKQYSPHVRHYDKIRHTTSNKPVWNKGLKGVQTAWNKGLKGVYHIDSHYRLNSTCKIENVWKHWIDYNIDLLGRDAYLYVYHSKHALSEQQRQKLSAALKGKGHPCDESTKQKISKANSGKHRSEDFKEKVSNSLKGRKKPPFTESHKANLSAKAKEQWSDPEMRRLKSQQMKGRHWYTNGIINVQAKESPGEDFYLGRTNKRNSIRNSIESFKFNYTN